jgi:ring-1,2-phenylacetyl-CoA epoxidase subunit PaaE
MPPMGHFNVPLEAANRKHYVGFAAGSGITPLLSIIKTTLLTEPAAVSRCSTAIVRRVP